MTEALVLLFQYPPFSILTTRCYVVFCFRHLNIRFFDKSGLFIDHWPPDNRKKKDNGRLTHLYILVPEDSLAPICASRVICWLHTSHKKILWHSHLLPSSHIYYSEELLLPTDSLQNFVHLVFSERFLPSVLNNISWSFVCWIPHFPPMNWILPPKMSQLSPEVRFTPSSPNAEVKFTPSPNPPSHCPPTSLQ